jgi:hypothetical protein
VKAGVLALVVIVGVVAEAGFDPVACLNVGVGRLNENIGTEASREVSIVGALAPNAKAGIAWTSVGDVNMDWLSGVVVVVRNAFVVPPAPPPDHAAPDPPNVDDEPGVVVPNAPNLDIHTVDAV